VPKLLISKQLDVLRSYANRGYDGEPVYSIEVPADGVKWPGTAWVQVWDAAPEAATITRRQAAHDLKIRREVLAQRKAKRAGTGPRKKSPVRKPAPKRAAARSRRRAA